MTNTHVPLGYFEFLFTAGGLYLAWVWRWVRLRFTNVWTNMKHMKTILDNIWNVYGMRPKVIESLLWWLLLLLYFWHVSFVIFLYVCRTHDVFETFSVFVAHVTLSPYFWWAHSSPGPKSWRRAVMGPTPRRHFGSQAWVPGWKTRSKNEQVMQIMRHREHIWKYMEHVWNKYEIYDELLVHTMYTAYLQIFPVYFFIYTCSICLEIVGWSRLCRWGDLQAKRIDCATL